MHFTRRTFIKGLLVTAGAGTAAAWKLNTTFDLEVKTYRLPLLKSPGTRPVRIAHLSDLHASKDVPFSFLEEVFEQVCDLKPDVICLTGDYISNGLPRPILYSALLRKLSDCAPCLAVTGNHDGGRWAHQYGGLADSSDVVAMLHQAGMTVINNQSTTLQVNGQNIRITGLGDSWAGEFNPEAAFTEAHDPHTPHIVLSHNPDTKDPLRNYPWDLLLSGHTHGGQLRIPGIGAPLGPRSGRTLHRRSPHLAEPTSLRQQRHRQPPRPKNQLPTRCGTD